MIKLNGKEIIPTIFPDKTSQVWKIPNWDWLVKETNFVSIEWVFESESEFIHVAQLKMLLDNFNIKSSLRLPYLPYARQDKQINNDSTFALKTFAQLINSLEFQTVSCYDVHSDVAKDLIKNLDNELPKRNVTDICCELDIDLICYPDAGAANRYSNKMDWPFILGEKIRNQSTGNIDSYKLIGNPKDRSILIVDDICDGGATFILLANELIKQGASEINLYVSHGIFSKGKQILKDAKIKRIFTKEGEEL